VAERAAAVAGLGMTMPADGFWRDRPVLVTGATGLLGAWVVRRLIDAGSDVIGLVRDWVPRSHLVQGDLWNRITVVRGDVRDQALLERVLGEYEVDTVCHLAAQTLVPVSNRNPVSTFETNIGGTWALLEACRRSPAVRQIVVASSDKAYGDHDALPYTEDVPLRGRHPYDASKSCADLIAQAYATTFGLPVAVTRCGNLFGPGDLNWSRIVPGTIRSVLRGRRPIIRSDGLYVRDYIDAEDAAAATLLLAERLGADRALAGEAFNFSHERPMTVLEIVTLVLSLMSSALEPDIRNEATGEIRRQYLDAQKARSVLGWRPLRSLEEGLGRAIDWYRGLLGVPA
jgi:CDP-glucose 4,6-dehydratase